MTGSELNFENVVSVDQVETWPCGKNSGYCSTTALYVFLRCTACGSQEVVFEVGSELVDPQASNGEVVFGRVIDASCVCLSCGVHMGFVFQVQSAVDEGKS